MVKTLQLVMMAAAILSVSAQKRYTDEEDLIDPALLNREPVETLIEPLVKEATHFKKDTLMHKFAGETKKSW